MASSAIFAEPIYEEGNEIPGETESVSNTSEVITFMQLSCSHAAHERWAMFYLQMLELILIIVNMF